MDNDSFNMSLRKFLKKVGVTSQREIEASVRENLDAKHVLGNETLAVKVNLSIDQLNLDVDIEGEIHLT
ncbi:MAG: DUF6494 family protein [Pseudomonadota bacterium]|nr:DUF6494 family protein [Pseudomonadota bacterium]